MLYVCVFLRVMILSEWDILFVGVAKGNEIGDQNPVFEEFGIPINNSIRTVDFDATEKSIRFRSSRIGSPDHERYGLSLDQKEAAQKDIDDNKKGKSASGHIYRFYRERPLLVLFSITACKDNQGIKEKVADKTVIAWGISFPKTENKTEPEEFTVNAVWMKNRFGPDLDEEEIEDELR